MHGRRMLGSVPVVVLLLVAAAHSLPAQGRGEGGGFVVRLGSDTVAVERYERAGASLTGDLVLRSPRTRIIHYEATLARDGTMSRIELTSTPVTVGQPAGRSTQSRIDFHGDSADVRTELPDSTLAMRVKAGPGALPLVTFSYALSEAAVMQARRAGHDSVTYALVSPGSPASFATTIVRRGADSVLISYFGAFARANVDRAGRILGLDGAGTTEKVVVERVPAVDIESVAQRFATADASGRSMGTLSPRDTVRATVGRAKLLIDYSRPAKRGRVIFGGLEPWGSIWRTGANAATQLETDADLEMGGTTIPAGKYTLWTLLAQSAPMLIVNKRTGQWGTEYDAAQDLVRIPLRVSKVEPSVERFTIAIDPQGTGGVLRLVWDTTAFSVPLAAK